MKPSEVAAIRTRLRSVNVEYSALVKNAASEKRLVRMAQLRRERSALMGLLSGAATGNALRVIPLGTTNQHVR